MAKREVPEINAGSMADIAFLLLIFFLVTTTMDKDQAFMRSIPKKVLNPPPPPEIFMRDICDIKANNNNQLLFRGELLANPDDISEKIVEFYRFNQKSNDLTSNFPLYTRLTKDEINVQLDKLDSEIERMESTPDQSEEILKYNLDARAEWQLRLDALKMYGKSSLPEVASAAHVRVDVQKKTSYELFAKIHTEIQEAIRELKNEEAKKMWNTTFDILSKKADSDPGDREVKAQLDLLKLLYNVRIIEVTPK